MPPGRRTRNISRSTLRRAFFGSSWKRYTLVNRDYLKDDLESALREVGFEVESSEPCFVAKVVVAKKPG
jgi:hypothetical protein